MVTTTNKLIVVQDRGDVFVALSEIDTAMGADTANLIRAYITALEYQADCLRGWCKFCKIDDAREQIIGRAERLNFYGAQLDAVIIAEMP